MIPSGRFIYVGPSIDGVAIRNTIYSEVPRSIRDAIQIRPYFGGLCIPISKLAQALKDIQFKDGYYFTLYNRALRESRKIQKGEK